MLSHMLGQSASWEAIFEGCKLMNLKALPPEAPPSRDELIDSVITTIQMLTNDVLLWTPDGDFLGTLDDLLGRKCQIGSIRVNTIMANLRAMEITNAHKLAALTPDSLKHIGLSAEESQDLMFGARYMRVYEKLQGLTNDDIKALKSRVVEVGLMKTGNSLDVAEALLDKK